jgi:hypothetical protein
MAFPRRKFTRECKDCRHSPAGCRGIGRGEGARMEVHRKVLHRWRKEFSQGPGRAFPGIGRTRWDRGQVAQVERNIGQPALEIDFLKGCLQPIDEERLLPGSNWKVANCRYITEQIEKGCAMTIARMCRLGTAQSPHSESLQSGPRENGPGCESAGCDPADRTRVSLLWRADYCGTEEAAMAGGRPPPSGRHYA